MFQLVTFLYSQYAIYKNRIDHFECKNKELDNDFYFCFKYIIMHLILKQTFFKWLVCLDCQKSKIYNFFIFLTFPACFQIPIIFSNLKSNCSKVHIFWEGHKILWNLHQLFDWQYIGQIIGGDFAKFCGLLRIYELYLLCAQPQWRKTTSWQYSLCFLFIHNFRNMFVTFFHNFITNFQISGAAFCQQKVSVWWQKTNSWRYSLCLSRFRYIHNSASARFCPDFQMAVGEGSGKITHWWHRSSFFSHWHRFYQANVELWISSVLPTYIKVWILDRSKVQGVSYWNGRNYMAWRGRKINNFVEL